ncbi:MAG: hypothetical protein GY842_11185, partial [bacterium]|nr:hypothetical protein [bacterium]
MDPDSLEGTQGQGAVRAIRRRIFRVDAAALASVLEAAPREFSEEAERAATQIILPMPDGSYARFRFVESPIMASELAGRYPEIKTYSGQGVDDPAASVRFDRTPAGFHAQILAPAGTIYVDPLGGADRSLHASYYRRDCLHLGAEFTCEVLEAAVGTVAVGGGEDWSRTGELLRTYRLACAATGEYTGYHGGTVPEGMAAITTAVNRVTGIYETELAIRLELAANNDLLVFTNSATDPYSNWNGSAMMDQNQATVDSIIGSANYDIGHVFSTGGGGIAGLGFVCVDGWKAKGVTGLANPEGDAFFVDYVAHEMGHQFGAHHTFNGGAGSCDGNRNSSTAYEPGSGSTIMGYAGICGADNLQANSDPYFHSESFSEIRNYVTSGSGSGCPTTAPTGNSDPTVAAGLFYTIPQATPFVLTAVGSDPDSDPITYCWEQRDLGDQAALGDPDDGAMPLFRSWSPTSSPQRVFPRLEDLLNNTTSPGEQLPTTFRTMSFRASVRDNRSGGGGSGFDDTQVTVHAGAGPFMVTAPTTGAEVWSTEGAVTWDVAATDVAP